MNIQEMKTLLIQNEIEFEELRPAQYAYSIPDKFKQILEYNLQNYNLNELVMGAEMKTRMAPNGVMFLHAPKASAFWDPNKPCTLIFNGPFQTGFYLVSRLLSN